MRQVGPRFTFTEDVLKELWPIARNRNERSRARGVRNERRDASRTDLQVDWMGVLAEYAVAQVIGGVPHLGDDGGDGNQPDVLLPNGKGVEVKSTMKRGYNLIAKATGTIDSATVSIHADYMVLVWPVDNRNVEVVGWVTTKRFKNYGEVRMLPGGLSAYMAWKDLSPMSLWSMNGRKITR